MMALMLNLTVRQVVRTVYQFSSNTSWWRRHEEDDSDLPWSGGKRCFDISTEMGETTKTQRCRRRTRVRKWQLNAPLTICNAHGSVHGFKSVEAAIRLNREELPGRRQFEKRSLRRQAAEHTPSDLPSTKGRRPKAIPTVKTGQEEDTATDTESL